MGGGASNASCVSFWSRPGSGTAISSTGGVSLLSGGVSFSSGAGSGLTWGLAFSKSTIEGFEESSVAAGVACSLADGVTSP